MGAELGAGNQGTVYALADDPTTAVKLYTPNTAPHEPGLMALIEARASMSATDRSVIDARCTWPHALVFDGDKCCGFTMRRVPTTFESQTASGPILAKLQHALDPRRAQRLGLRLPDARGLVNFALAFTETVCILHRNDVALGDISQRNLVWVLGPGGTVNMVLIDIDSAGVVGHPTALPAVQTPHWIDPNGPGPSFAGDRYKTALVMYRLLHADPKGLPEADDPILDTTTDRWSPELGDLTRRALHGPAPDRPGVDEWPHALRTVGSSTATNSGPAHRVRPNLSVGGPSPASICPTRPKRAAQHNGRGVPRPPTNGSASRPRAPRPTLAVTQNSATANRVPPWARGLPTWAQRWLGELWTAWRRLEAQVCDWPRSTQVIATGAAIAVVILIGLLVAA